MVQNDLAVAEFYFFSAHKNDDDAIGLSFTVQTTIFVLSCPITTEVTKERLFK